MCFEPDRKPDCAETGKKEALGGYRILEQRVNRFGGKRGGKWNERRTRRSMNLGHVLPNSKNMSRLYVKLNRKKRGKESPGPTVDEL